MDQIHSKLVLPITLKGMTSSKTILYHLFYSIARFYFFHSLSNFICHIEPVFLFCNRSIGTHLFDALVFVLDFQVISPFRKINLRG